MRKTIRRLYEADYLEEAGYDIAEGGVVI